jgi:hypothetical protein
MRSLSLFQWFALGALSASAAGLCSCSESSGAVTRTYDLGTKAQVGTLGYTVFERQWLNQLGEPGSTDDRVPQNRFLLLRISVLNSGGAEVSVPNLKLIDDKGKSYDEVTNEDHVSQAVGAIRELKPADTLQGNVLFDVPPQHYKVAVSDEDGKETAYVDLPLSFDATTPDIPDIPRKK